MPIFDPSYDPDDHKLAELVEARDALNATLRLRDQPNQADYRDDWQALRRELRRLFEERLEAGVWPRKKDGTLTQQGQSLAFDWLVGVHAGLVLSGSENGLGPLVFIASVRGVEDATRIREEVDA